MKPAELKMELLIPLSLLSSFFFPMSLFSLFFSPFIVPNFSSPGTILANSSPTPPFWTSLPLFLLLVCVLWVLCCSSDKNRD